MEKNRFVWIEGKSVYSLTTTCDEKEIEAIISSFGEQQVIADQARILQTPFGCEQSEVIAGRQQIYPAAVQFA